MAKKQNIDMANSAWGITLLVLGLLLILGLNMETILGIVLIIMGLKALIKK